MRPNRMYPGKVPLSCAQKPLSGFVRELWARARAHPAAVGTSGTSGPLARLSASLDLARAVYGLDAVMQASALPNVAEYALAVRERFVVHSVREGAARLARETVLPIVPDRSPVALEAPLLVEARHPDRGDCLVSNITGIAAWPQVDNTHGACIRLLVRTVPDGLYVFRWVPRWTGEDVESTVDLAGLAGFDTASDVGAFAVRFLLVFSLLLEASRSPLETSDPDDTGAASANAKGGGRGKTGGPRPPAAPTGIATTRHVYLSRDFERERAVALQQAQAQARAATALRTDLAPAPVMVAGHLQRYPVGPRDEGRREWRFVAPYRSTRLVGPRSTVDVHRARGDKA